MGLTRRRLLGLTLVGPLLAACRADPYALIGAPSVPTPSVKETRELLLWHADAVVGERVVKGVVAAFPTRVAALAHGDPDDLLRRATHAAAGGVGPEVLQLPGEWLPEAVENKVVLPLPAGFVKDDEWSGGLAESGRWAAQSYGVPAAPYFAQPFYNDELLRNAGLIQVARTTPPSNWAEYADVCKRVASPEDRWGALLPTHRADEELFLHIYQHVLSAGGDIPRPTGGRIKLDTPQLRSSLELLLDLLRNRGALPADREAYRIAETGRAGLWWARSTWLAGQTAMGNKIKVGSASAASAATATPAPSATIGGRGVLLRSRHWCLGASGTHRDDALELLRYLATDEASGRYCGGLSLPPARRANAARAVPTATPFAPVWPAILEQLAQPDNRPLITFPGYRALAGRLAGELMLVLTGRKPLDVAMVEGEAGANELLSTSKS
jgi:ABC-type glycerol-3-phosphate transport system substrate-binding protein